MGWIGKGLESFSSLQIRPLLEQAISLGIIICSALMIWKGLMCITGSESPVVVVLSESMEPGFQRGDILFLHMNNDPVQVGEIVVYNVKVHEQQSSGELDILTKGDNNDADDRTGLLYAPGQLWLQQNDILGRAVGFLPELDVEVLWNKECIINTTEIGVKKYAYKINSGLSSFFSKAYFEE